MVFAQVRKTMKQLDLQNLSHKKYFIFDFDGTLVDLEQLNIQCFTQTFAELLGVALEKQDYYKYISGTGSKGGVMNYIRAKGLSEKLYTACVKRFSELKNLMLTKDVPSIVSVKPGVEKYLKWLVQNGKKLVIATSSHREYVKRILEAFNLFHYFEDVTDASDVVKVKPEPDIFLVALKKLSGQKDEAVVFEDSLNGVEAARRSGMDFVVIYKKGVNDWALNKEKFVISDYRELLPS